MNIEPTFVLEDDEGIAPSWITAPLDGFSLFSVDRVLAVYDEALAFILRENRDSDGSLNLRGGYAFFGLGDGVLLSHHDLDLHMEWDTSIAELRAAERVEWHDRGGGGFRFLLEKTDGVVRVSHSRGKSISFEAAAFFDLAAHASIRMTRFKSILERSVLALSDPRIDRVSLHDALWKVPERRTASRPKRTEKRTGLGF